MQYEKKLKKDQREPRRKKHVSCSPSYYCEGVKPKSKLLSEPKLQSGIELRIQRLSQNKKSEIDQI
jgi:hypothetical protein